MAHEPRVCLAVLQELLAPAVQAGQLRLLLNTSPTGADMDGDRVRAVRLFNASANRDVSIQARYFVDASETGDLLPLTGTEFVTGSESQAQTGEPHASPEPRPANMQAITWCYAVDHFHVNAYPYQIPLGVLIPRRVENLIAGGKNLGTTHLSNGAYRLHPTEWNIGESAGALAAFCLEKHESPCRIRQQAPLRSEFQARLAQAGVELDWSKLAQM